MHFLSFRARKICSPSNLEKNLDRKNKSDSIQLAEKQNLSIQLPFKGNPMCECITKRLQLAIKRTHPAASLR